MLYISKHRLDGSRASVGQRRARTADVHRVDIGIMAEQRRQRLSVATPTARIQVMAVSRLEGGGGDLGGVFVSVFVTAEVRVRYELVVRVRVAELAAFIAVVLVVDVLRIDLQDDVLEDEVEDPLALVVVAAQVAAGRVGRVALGRVLGRGSRGEASRGSGRLVDGARPEVSRRTSRGIRPRQHCGGRRRAASARRGSRRPSTARGSPSPSHR